MPYAMLWYSPEPLKGAVLDGVNAIFTKQAPPPASWLGGQIRFLFKKGDVQDASCYRPVCFQVGVYMLLLAIFTDRLYRLAERHWGFIGCTPRSARCSPCPGLLSKRKIRKSSCG
jgi:hypothetical protein